jgi:ferric-dicitrate binding protein FerR (iron transport regulator)
MKAKNLPSKVDRLILEAASEWFVDFRVGDVDQDSRTRFDEWLRRSPEHIRAYMEIAKTYVELPALASPLDVDALIKHARSGENVVPFDSAGFAPPGSIEIVAAEHELRSARSVRALRRTPRRFLSAAACVLFLVIAGAVWWQTLYFPTYATDIGERRSLTLADGSTVDLNARSKLRVEFNKQERRVLLLAGEALFQVAKDKNRPFIVASGEASVRAVGTQFDVYRKEGGTTVTVLEGRVAVYSTAAIEPASQGSASTLAGASTHSAQLPDRGPPGAVPLASESSSSGNTPLQPYAPVGLADPSGSGAVFLSAGEQVTVTPTQILPAPAHADIAATTAWIQRRLIFDGSRLSDVVQEFNRYNRRQIIVAGAELSDFHVSGVYSSSDPASLIRFLRDQPGVKITESADEVRIESH